MKLWQKDYKLNKEIEKFTVGNDFLLDKELVKYDVLGSIAHAMMLNKINIINKNELQKLKNRKNTHFRGFPAGGFPRRVKIHL